ncbi:MAG: hypothetical protein H6712_05250 [Myxococcales bacterium]|nr:hypothetical protein [Myxococcales bacterium]MCB9713239.1 hypothetical protein [Myxococcales bacterium]
MPRPRPAGLAGDGRLPRPLAARCTGELFDEQGYPAVRFTEVTERYERQHQDPREQDGLRYGDDPEHVDESYLAEVARLDGAVLIHLANAPSPPPGAAVVAV